MAVVVWLATGSCCFAPTPQVGAVEPGLADDGATAACPRRNQPPPPRHSGRRRATSRQTWFSTPGPTLWLESPSISVATGTATVGAVGFGRVRSGVDDGGLVLSGADAMRVVVGGVAAVVAAGRGGDTPHAAVSDRSGTHPSTRDGRLGSAWQHDPNSRRGWGPGHTPILDVPPQLGPSGAVNTPATPTTLTSVPPTDDARHIAATTTAAQKITKELIVGGLSIYYYQMHDDGLGRFERNDLGFV
ncbi:hypothetical protein, variant [Aphanomyces invadans]|uniref:Uncharacterized protein n=1 Tax=Aphanomyces invadans TaxID=157072 RepID=A0A024UEC3_9STRA|nr:hypothetical protein, variant [Aphanomyces invadans]XP_008865994.1 hypothetical protein H310_03781 [Aphanomyces invadans]ETW04555.1 hypothetical protein H310_03781 [Aphanomyces invadans]ETW04556.1 hypothetical protein, variant [Aphanomyces invadans]|eukprot:XP_008865993.1 hypothetical protein, variant [Aphanomyces invadans]